MAVIAITNFGNILKRGMIEYFLKINEDVVNEVISNIENESVTECFS